MDDIHARLERQALRRELSPQEAALAQALMEIFGGGVHAFDAVAVELTARGLARPSGRPEPWSAETLLEELAASNASFDAAYAAASPLAAYA